MALTSGQKLVHSRICSKTLNEFHRMKKRAYAKAFYESHREQLNNQKKTHYYLHKEEYRAYHQSQIEQKHAYDKLYYQSHKEKKKLTSKNRYKVNSELIKRKMHRYDVRIRMEVINHYGNKCACCGELNIEFLAIDHINGGGNKHRRELKLSSGTAFYNWIIKNNYPDTLRILCHNCNTSLGLYGYCPHNKPVQPPIQPIAPSQI